jgi:uncharacterized repeat protein (TIGR01451 family)
MGAVRFLAVAAVVLAIGAVLTGSASPSQQAPQLTCKYGSKYVTKIVHGHKKRVKVCKKKPKPKPPPPQADLELTMRSNLDQVTAGNHVSYSLIVENQGPQIAEATTMSVDLPPGKMQVYGSGGSGEGDTCTVTATATNNHIQCDFGQLGVESDDESAGLSAYAFATVQLEPSQPGDYTASAKAIGSTVDPSPENAAATKPLRVLPGPPAADLSVSLQSPPTPASVPDGFAQTISVTNAGPSEATDVVVSVLLPQGASATQPIPANTGLVVLLTGFCPPYAYTFYGASVVCFDAVRSGETKTATLRVTPSIHSPTTLRTDAVVSSYTRDSNLANNRASGETAVSPFQPTVGPDLRLAFDQPPALSAGKQLILPFRLANLGLGDVDDVTVEASTTPSVGNLALSLSTSDSGFGCASTDSGPISCQLPELESDAHAVGAIYAPSAAAGAYTATITITSPDLSAPVTSTVLFQVK